MRSCDESKNFMVCRAGPMRGLIFDAILTASKTNEQRLS